MPNIGQLFDVRQLEHFVRVEQAVEAQDSHGQAIETWTLFAETWMSIRPLTGREFFAAAQLQGEVTARAYTRYIPGLVPKMRIVHDGKVWNIRYVFDLELRNIAMELLLTEGVNDG